MVCPMVQCLHELYPCVSPMFVCCSGDLVVHLLQGGRGGISGSEVVTCSHPFQYFSWNRLCINTVSSRGVCCDSTFRMMVRKIFSPIWQFVGNRLFAQLSSVSLQYRSQFAFFKLKLVRWDMGLIVMSICKLMRIGRWSEPRFLFVRQLIEVIREADDSETSGEDGLALPNSLVGESQVNNTEVGARYHILQ